MHYAVCLTIHWCYLINIESGIQERVGFQLQITAQSDRLIPVGWGKLGTEKCVI